jgi:hypothetical protein
VTSVYVVARGFFGKFEFLFSFSDNMENMDTNSQQNISHFLVFLKIFEKNEISQSNMIKDGNKFRKKQLLTITLLFFTTLLSNRYKRQMMLQKCQK